VATPTNTGKVIMPLIRGTEYTNEEEVVYRTMEDLIKQYARKYPIDWGAAMKLIAAKRVFHKDKYGLGNDKNSLTREVAEIPAHLNKLLKIIDPDFDTGEKFKKFLKRFPIFLTVEKL